jgi:hypothetical protein
MRPPAQKGRRRVVLSQALAVSASLAALLSAFWGMKIGLPRLDDTRQYWNDVAPSLRDDPVADLYGFGEPLWVELRRSVGAGDRYAVVAEGEGQHEIRNYAAYSLLPAIQVRDPADADVVVYHGVAAPPGTDCLPVGNDVCVVRRSG